MFLHNKPSQQMRMITMNLPGLNNYLSPDSKDQSLSIELFWDQLKDLPLFLLNILLENGHSLSRQDKFSFAQLVRYISHIVRKFINISINQGIIVNLISPKRLCQIELESVKNPNGITFSQQVRRKNKVELLTLIQETQAIHWLNKSELTFLLKSSRIYIQRNLEHMIDTIKTFGSQKTTELIVLQHLHQLLQLLLQLKPVEVPNNSS